MKTTSNDNQDISLKDLLDISTLQNLWDSFTRLFGIPAAILGLKGEVLIASGWHSICTEFHRKNPTTSAKCLESDTVLAGQLAKGEKYNIYKCKNGLVDVAVPIIIDKIHVGNLFAGQFFFEPPDIVFFKEQAELYDFNKAPYLDALSKVPVFSTEKIKQAMDFLTDLTVVIGNIGIDKKKLLEYSESLEQRIQDRTTDLETEIKIRKKTEVKVQESTIFLESIFDAIQDGIAVLDMDFNILKVNNTMNQWYPHLKDSIGDKCYKIFRGRSEPCENCPAIRTFKTKKMEVAEVPLLSEDGVIGTLELFTFPIKDKLGEITGIVEYVRDISERKQTEHSLKLQTKTLNDILEKAADGICVCHNISELPYVKFTLWNPRMTAITGYTIEEINQLGWYQSLYLDPEVQQKAIERMANMRIGDDIVAEEWIVTTKDRNQKTLSISTTVLKEDNGCTFVLAMIQDVSERHRLQEALKANQRLLAESQKVGKVGGWEFSIDTKKLVWTEETYVIHEVDLAYDLTLDNGINFYIPASRPIIQQAVQRAIEYGESFDVDLEIMTAKGNLRSVNAIGTADMEHRRIYGFFQDITERKRLERQLLNTKKLEATAILAGGIAHDFNNLLAVITGYIDLVLHDLGKNHRNADDLNQALKAGERAQELTNKFITFSSGGTPVKRKSSIKELITQSVNTVLSDTDYTAELSLGEDLWQVEMDTDQMSPVFKNVLLNAKESMDGGGIIRIRIENISSLSDEAIVAETSTGTQFVKIVITDQGNGMPDSISQNIFDPYFSTKKRGAQKGMGLGLTVALSIVQQHNGQIVIKSEINVGTSVYIYLPAAV
jgi:PAS domain S-box-containing protein